MPNYRRMRVDGGCWFFTVNLHNRRQTLLTDHIGLLRDAVARTQQTRPFTIDAFVVLPDHIHTIWTLPAEDSDFSTRWRSIKIHFAKALPTLEARDEIRIARGERGIWQRRFWEHMIRDDRDYENHVNYCYINPVKHGLVGRVADWPYSSFHRDVRAGIFPEDWAGDASIIGSFGER
jgi:putative transposase